MPDQPAAHLNLWKQRLGRVPESVWDQAGLETLVLADNDLTEISGQIGRLRRLRMLDLGHNQLTAVPDSLGDLDGLSDFLYLHDNRLASLPASLQGLTEAALSQYQRERFRNISRLRMRHGESDRAQGQRQRIHLSSRFGRAAVPVCESCT